MADLEPILIAHYRAVREEEMERLKHRDRYIVWFVTLSAAAAGVYTKDAGWWGLLAILPFIGFICGAMYAHTDMTLGALGRWLRHTYSDTITAYRTDNGLNFDRSFSVLCNAACFVAIVFLMVRQFATATRFSLAPSASQAFDGIVLPQER